MSTPRSPRARGTRADGTRADGTRADDTVTLRPSGVLAFVVELAMLVLLADVGWWLGTGVATSILFALLLAGAAVVVWAVWLAPRAERRLARLPRLVAKAALFAATAVLTAVSGLTVWAVAFAVLAAVSLVWDRD